MLSEEPTTLARNLAALRSKWGSAPEIDAAAPSSTVRVSPCAAILGSDGRWLTVHDSVDPGEEARSWLRPSMVNGAAPSLACVIGAGLGYIVDAIAEEMPATKVLVLEPEPVLAAAMLGRRDWTALIEAGRLMLLVGPQYCGRHQAWQMFAPASAPALRLLHPVICGTREAAAREAARVIARAQQGALNNERARQAFAGIYIRNTSANAAALGCERDASTLFGSCRGTPVVLAAAGPSLDRNIEELRPYRDRVTLIAVDTALAPLVSAGLAPDIVVTIDPSDVNARHLLESPASPRTLLVAEASIAPEVVKRFRGRVFFYRVGRHDPWPWLASVGLDVGLLRAWGSVTTTTFDLALRLGGDPIVFVGADLAYSLGRPYCSGVVFEREWSAQPRPIEEVWRDIVTAPETVEALDVHARTVRTTPVLVACRDWLVEQIAQTSSPAVWNATGAGLLSIARQASLARVLDAVPPRTRSPVLIRSRHAGSKPKAGMTAVDRRLLAPPRAKRGERSDEPVAPTPYMMLDEATRVARTRRLAATKQTDIERWADVRNVRFRSTIPRARAAARLIPPRCHVLDLGAGTEALRDAIDPTCRYTPADVVRRSCGTVVVDLNGGEFPEGSFDVAVALAVLEYIYDVQTVLRRAAGAAPAAVISYCAQPDRTTSGERFGWCNALTFVDLLDLVNGTGWHVARAEILLHEPAFTQWLLALRQLTPAGTEAA